MYFSLFCRPLASGRSDPVSTVDHARSLVPRDLRVLPLSTRARLWARWLPGEPLAAGEPGAPLAGMAPGGTGRRTVPRQGRRGNPGGGPPSRDDRRLTVL